ncbi:MAG TPA: hypothetical protein VMW27_11590 [Thermoanaerobaculia bacterium]|nr:hypothetical protein [Thermoanaerobaculia bacterium]
MKNVIFRIDPEVTLEIRHLRGELVPTHEGEPPWFDDPGSFVLDIAEGEIAVTAQSMSALLNRYVFTGKDAPVRDVEIEIVGNHLRQSSTLQKKVKVRAVLEGDLSATPEGDIRLHPTSIKAEGLPVKGLLDLFDVELDELMKTQKSRGVGVEGNDLLLDPERLLPPPRIRGRITAVRIEPGRIVQIFGGGSPGSRLKPSLPEAANYMFYSGHELSFGKLTMHDSDLQIVDMDPDDPFHFYLKELQSQLVAGYSKTMPDRGLVAYMPDFDELGKRSATGGR